MKVDTLVLGLWVLCFVWQCHSWFQVTTLGSSGTVDIVIGHGGAEDIIAGNGGTEDIGNGGTKGALTGNCDL